MTGELGAARVMEERRPCTDFAVHSFGVAQLATDATLVEGSIIHNPRGGLGTSLTNGVQWLYFRQHPGG